MGNLISFMKEVAEGLRKSGNYGTAHVYRSSMNAIIAFNGSRNLSFKKVNQEFLKSFETYLREKDCSWNTVSTYMRTLRAVYNRAVDRRMASYIPHHFRYVYTGTRADRKRALEMPFANCRRSISCISEHFRHCKLCCVNQKRSVARKNLGILVFPWV